MNLFVLWKTREGKTELVTAPLDGTILPGVTRRSIIELGQHWGNFDVTERPYTMTEVLEARKEDRVCFLLSLRFLSILLDDRLDVIPWS